MIIDSHYWVKPGKPSKVTILYTGRNETWLDKKWFDSDAKAKFHKWEDHHAKRKK